jgi:hypothetical protein
MGVNSPQLTMLKGAELLDLIKSMPDASKSELVRAAGYVSTKKDGTERLNFTGFYEATLEAKGTVFGEKASSKSGRKLSFVASVQFNGNLMIGKSYVQMMDAKPGDQYRIVLTRNNGIRLVPLADPVSAEEGDVTPAACPAPTQPLAA